MILSFYRLAANLGIWDVEGENGLVNYPGSLDQLKTWLAYYQLEPFGEERDDLRAGIISAAVTNGILSIAAGMAGKSNYTSVSPLDFMPLNKMGKEESKSKELTIEEKRAQWKAGKERLKARLRKVK